MTTEITTEAVRANLNVVWTLVAGMLVFTILARLRACSGAAGFLCTDAK